jgi:two-component system, sensor histidine kinase PdtaS
MVQQGEVDQGCVWRAEARHRADNLRQLATSLQRLIDIGRIDPGNRPRTIGRVNALARAYRTLDQSDAADPHSCAQGLRDIAAGLVEIFGHTVGSLVLSLDIEPLALTGGGQRALQLAVSELVVNALRHAFVDRQTGILHIRLEHDRARQEAALVVADDGVGPGDLMHGGGTGRGIVRDLAAVLNGDVVWRQSPLLGGTEVILRFPLPALIPTAYPPTHLTKE